MKTFLASVVAGTLAWMPVARAAHAPERQRLVVATFDEQGVPAGMGDVVSDMLLRAIDAPGYELLERRQVRRVLEEQAFASSDLTQPGDAVRYGRLADTRFVLVGTVYRIDGDYIVSARMVDSATGVVQESARAVVQFRTVDEMASRVAELARALGLRVGALPSAAPADAPPVPGVRVPAEASTVRDYLEQVGAQGAPEVRVAAPGNLRTVREGEEIRFTVRSERDGFLSLFVVDAEGRVGALLPNARSGSLPVRAGQSVSVPRDVPFVLTARPPFGPTRIKAIITGFELRLQGGSDPGEVLRRVELGEPVGVPVAGGGKSAPQPVWSGAELEFLVVPLAATPSPPHVHPTEPGTPPPAAPRPADPAPVRQPAGVGAPGEGAVAVGGVGAGRSIALAFARIAVAPTSLPGPADSELLRWPLACPFPAGCDIGWTSGGVPAPPRIAVVDADFDPDDPLLERAFAGITAMQREEFRAEIRRNGRAPFRHGNRVASLIAGDAPWLPACLPGAPVVPIRITTSVDAPGYRAEKGGAAELLVALRAALAAGCRVVNLSLSVPLPDEAERRAFAADPVWDELERAGAVVVCAAGNGREDLDADPRFPACLDRPNVLCVGAVGPDGRIATWGEQGSAHGARSVDVMAPGSMIAVSDGGGRAGLADGTSYACAFATAAVARLLAQAPGLSGSAAVDRIVADARRDPSLRGLCRGGLLRWPGSGN